MKKRVYLDTCVWCRPLFEILRRELSTEECLTYLQVVTPKIGDATDIRVTGEDERFKFGRNRS